MIRPLVMKFRARAQLRPEQVEVKARLQPYGPCIGLQGIR